MNIQIRATISQAWPLVKSSKRVFLCTFLALVILQSFLLCIQEEAGILYHHASWINPVFTIIMIFLSSPIMAGFAMVGLKRSRSQSVKWKTGLSYYKKILPLFSAYFISTFVTWFAGMIIIYVLFTTFNTMAHLHWLNAEPLRIAALVLFFLISALVIIAVNLFFNFSYMLILDHKERFHLAVWHSVKMVWANYKKLYGLALLLSLFNLLGLIPVGLGLLWTIPLTYVCMGLIYQKLRTH